MPLAIPAASRCWSDLLPLNACGNKPLAGLTSAGVFLFVDDEGPTIELNSAAIRGALSFV
jgi:hypothetical protein